MGNIIGHMVFCFVLVKKHIQQFDRCDENMVIRTLKNWPYHFVLWLFNQARFFEKYQHVRYFWLESMVKSSRIYKTLWSSMIYILISYTYTYIYIYIYINW